MELTGLLNTPWLMVGLIVSGIALVVFAILQVGVRAKQQYQRLLREGEPAEAVVIAVKDTGWRTNKRPHLSYEVEVFRPGHQPYRTKLQLLLDGRWSTNPYPAGSRVRVRVDRNQPERVAIEGAQPVIGGGLAPQQGIALISGGTQTSTINTYTVNGQSYTSLEAIPPEARAAVEQAFTLLANMPQGTIPTSDAGAGTAGERLRELERLRTEGLITAAEYEAKRAEILGQL